MKRFITTLTLAVLFTSIGVQAVEKSTAIDLKEIKFEHSETPKIQGTIKITSDEILIENIWTNLIRDGYKMRLLTLFSPANLAETVCNRLGHEFKDYEHDLVNLQSGPNDLIPLFNADLSYEPVLAKNYIKTEMSKNLFVIKKIKCSPLKQQEYVRPTAELEFK